MAKKVHLFIRVSLEQVDMVADSVISPVESQVSNDWLENQEVRIDSLRRNNASPFARRTEF